MRKFFLLLAVLAMFISTQASLLIPLPFVENQQSFNFINLIDNSIVATVDCTVYSGLSGDYQDKYIYTYTINNISDKSFSWFSAQLGPVSDAWPIAIDPTLGGVVPANWELVTNSTGDSFTMEALFNPAIGDGQNSAVLWFASDYSWTQGDGALVGMVDGYVFAQGDLLVPVPEPASILMVGLGAVALLRSKKK